MKLTPFCAALALITTLSSFAEIEAPSIEASINYKSMKIERGMVENKESVFGYEVELGWYGIVGGIESCHDMTNINGRRGRYNEIESFLGYEHSFGDFSARIAYIYKRCILEEPDTQEVELELEYEMEYVTPFLALEMDTKEKPGATYGEFGLSHEFEIFEGFSAIPLVGVGFGTKGRNELDFETNRNAFRDIHLGLELEIELCEHLKLVPSVDLYDQFTSAARHEYEKGFAAVGGCHLVAEF